MLHSHPLFDVHEGVEGDEWKDGRHVRLVECVVRHPLMHRRVIVTGAGGTSDDEEVAECGQHRWSRLLTFDVACVFVSEQIG